MFHVSIQNACCLKTTLLSKVVDEPRVFIVCVLVPGAVTLNHSNPAAAQVVMERMSHPESFVFLKFPAGMKSAYILRDVAGEKSVLLPLDLLLQTLAVV